LAGPEIREATPADAEAIVSATESGWREGYAGIVSPERLEDLPVERWRHEVGVGLRRPVADAFTRIAEIDGEFAGYTYVAAPGRDGDLGPEVAELVAIYVLPERWRQGAGDALMRAALERLGELGYAAVVLWTFEANERALAFYERHGWARDGAERHNEPADAQVIRLRRELGPPQSPP
jgi:ribosomal protein S18 acetylase RimI-like enzyme